MYKNIANNLNLFEITIPSTIVPIPTNDDYDVGFIIRYFTQKVNDENSHIFEINEKVYQTYKTNTHWKVVELKWRIRGPKDIVYKNDGSINDKGVINSNKAAIARASQSLKNIGLYLPNLSQFHK